MSLSDLMVLKSKVIYYNQPLSEIEQSIRKTAYDVIYFRDPFNVEYDPKVIRAVVSLIRQALPHAESIDGITSYEDLLIEDKWQQYQAFKECMPYTQVLVDKNQFIEGKHVAKKRISSRAKGITFYRDEIKTDGSYIVQDILPIAKEYRVYSIDEHVLREGSVRSSKTPTSRVKALNVEKTPLAVHELAKRIADYFPERSFLGLDIALISSGEPFLLEVNRSPQFKKYNQLIGRNIALAIQ